MIDFKQLAQQYKCELLDRVMPFWMEKSIDKEFGGYFTCLERDGEVFDTDKFIWLQGREVWMLSTLYNKVEKRHDIRHTYGNLPDRRTLREQVPRTAGCVFRIRPR